MTKTEDIAARIARTWGPILKAMKVGESLRVRGFRTVTRCEGQDRFMVEGDSFCQKASEAAFDAVLADLEGC